MSKLEELLAELCPDGVKYKKLGEVLDYEQPSKYQVSDTNYNPSFRTPVLTAGQSFILGYTNEENGIYLASHKKPAIIFDDFTTSYHWVDFNFKVKSSAMKILHPDVNQDVNFRYIYYAMGTITYNPTEHARQWIGNYSKIRIPYPPRAIQDEIVRILDTFTKLKAELKAELKARKEQFKYYLNSYFCNSFEEMMRQSARGKVELRQLDELGTLTRGKRFVRDDIVDSGTPCIHYGDLYTYYGISATATKSYLNPEQAAKLRFAEKGDVVIVGAGENDTDIGVGVAWLGDEKAVVHDACYIYKHNMNPKYVSYYLRSEAYHYQIKKYVSSGKICAISASGIGKSLIPVVPIEEQNHIVSILDRFDKLCNDISEGLPAEINAREKQYEYYRDQLLTFKQKGIEA